MKPEGSSGMSAAFSTSFAGGASAAIPSGPSSQRTAPARLVVGRSGDVRFPGCTGRGLHLTPLERTLYAFVLRNPAGVRAEQMWEHYAELLEDYRRWTVFSDEEQAEAAVDALCDDDRSALQTNVSRIRRKFTDTIGREAALRFAIVRGKDGAYRIAAPRDAVVLLGA